MCGSSKHLDSDASPRALQPGAIITAASECSTDKEPIPDASLDTPKEVLPLTIRIPAPSDRTRSDSTLQACFGAGPGRGDVEDPDAPTWLEAITSGAESEWMEGARAELRSLEEMEVFELVPRSALPSGRKILRGKFVCRLKRDEHGNAVRYKVRWVAKGFYRYGERLHRHDFPGSPTARLKLLRIILHTAACRDWRIEQYDVRAAFLNGILPENEMQFMEQPPGFIAAGKEDYVWRL